MSIWVSASQDLSYTLCNFQSITSHGKGSAVVFHLPGEKTLLQNPEQVVHRSVVFVALPGHPAEIQCPDHHRAKAIVAADSIQPVDRTK